MRDERARDDGGAGASRALRVDARRPAKARSTSTRSCCAPTSRTACPGAPLEIAIQVTRAGDCAVLANARLDLWQADGLGLYSGYENQRGVGAGTPLPVGRTYLRGTQVTDADGWVRFTTIYPSWYGGRTPHLHFKVLLGGDEVVASQVFFPDEVSAEVFGTWDPYRRYVDRRTVFNANDPIEGSVLCDVHENDGGGVRASAVVAVARERLRLPQPPSTARRLRAAAARRRSSARGRRSSLLLSPAISVKRLQVAQLHRLRFAREQRRGLDELRRRLVLAVGVNDLRAPLALGFRLPCDRADHAFVDVDVLDLDVRDLDAPDVGRCVEDLLDIDVQPVALGEQLVELVLAEHGAQRRLRHLPRRFHVILDVDDGLLRIDDAEVDDRVHLHGNVVARDEVLRRHVEHLGAQIDADHLLHDRDQDDESRSFDAIEAAEHEDHAALVFAQHLERAEQQRGDDDSKPQENVISSLLGSCSPASHCSMLGSMLRVAASTRENEPVDARDCAACRPCAPGAASALASSR